MARRWWIVLLVATLTACSGTSTGASSGASGADSTTAPTAAPAPRPPALAQYFLRDNRVAAGQTQPVAAIDAQSPQAAVVALIKGPTDADQAAGLVTALAPTLQLRSLTLAGGTATADFSRDLESRDTQPAVGQIVFTLTQFPTITSVKFLIDGQPNGAAGVLPYTRADVPRVAPDLLLESPTPGETFTTPSIKVSGDIAMVRPSFDYAFKVGDQVVAQGTITTKFGTGPRKKFDQVIDLPAGTTGAVAMVVTQPAFTIPLTITS